jgi:alcohol dehydrogenase class IV
MFNIYKYFFGGVKMDNFNFSAPTQVNFGLGVVKKVKDYLIGLGKPKTMVVTDVGLLKAGIVDQVMQHIKESGVEIVLFSETEANPRIETIEKAANIAKEAGCGCVIGLGGGSSMDSAKMVATLLTHGGAVADYIGANKIPSPLLPLIAIPTTAGTGSEVTNNAVITDIKKKMKVVSVSYYLMPHVAFLDPELTLSVPPSITASTGMDAITHAIESYTNKVWNPTASALAEKSIVLISQNLRKAVHDGQYKAARYNMLLGSYLAGMAFNVTACGLVHAMSAPMGGVFDISHGIANSVLLPVITEYNIPGCLEESIRIAELMGAKTEGLPKWEAAAKCVEAVSVLSNDVGIPKDFKHMNASEADIQKMVDDSMLSRNVSVNPRKAGKEEIYKLFKMVF